jgi:hypothetical protein
MKHLRRRLTYANVMATLALVLALGGATAFAASQLGKNSVGSKQLKKNSVTAAKIKNGAVTQAKISRSAQNALKGATGPAGLKGATGPAGPQGPKGDPGPSNAYYAHGLAPAVTGLPAGDYVVYGQLVGENTSPLNEKGTVSGLTVVAAGTGESGQTPSSMGTFPSKGDTGTIPFQGVIHLPQGGAIGATYAGEKVTTTGVDITVIRVGSATP